MKGVDLLKRLKSSRSLLPPLLLFGGSKMVGWFCTHSRAGPNRGFGAIRVIPYPLQSRAEQRARSYSDDSIPPPEQGRTEGSELMGWFRTPFNAKSGQVGGGSDLFGWYRALPAQISKIAHYPTFSVRCLMRSHLTNLRDNGWFEDSIGQSSSTPWEPTAEKSPFWNLAFKFLVPDQQSRDFQTSSLGTKRPPIRCDHTVLYNRIGYFRPRISKSTKYF